MDLFSQNQEALAGQPLAERLRPITLDDFIGQRKFADPAKPLVRNLREKNYLPNLIIWGPPGSGKTTFARLLSREAKAQFVTCNAVETGAKELRELGLAAHHRRLQFQEKTILFIDEIHRLNKSQQDILLPFTEKGDLTLIGATTENPSYELNSALLSRSQVLTFERLAVEDLQTLLARAATASQTNLDEILSPEAAETLLISVAGDARQMLNIFESLAHVFKTQNSNYKFPLAPQDLEQITFTRAIRYDKTGAEHYDTISAFIKSVRGSDPDAAVYYLARMLDGGEDPVFLARRLVILASEDVGNADPKALPLAIAGLQAVELVGMPEGRISLAQVTTYLASAPKSNRAYMAINKAMDFVKKPERCRYRSASGPPKPAWQKSLGYGKDYEYSHDSTRGYIKQDFLPEEVKNQKFYEPSEHGFEKNIRQYLEWLHNEDTDH